MGEASGRRGGVLSLRVHSVRESGEGGEGVRVAPGLQGEVGWFGDFDSDAVEVG